MPPSGAAARREAAGEGDRGGARRRRRRRPCSAPAGSARTAAWAWFSTVRMPLPMQRPSRPSSVRPRERVVADRLVVGGLAADHAAEGDEAVEVARARPRGGSPSGSRARPAPRPSRGGRRASSSAARAPARRRVGDVAVEGRDDEEDAGRPLEARAGQGAVAFHQRASGQAPGVGIGRVPVIDRP